MDTIWIGLVTAATLFLLAFMWKMFTSRTIAL